VINEDIHIHKDNNNIKMLQ